MVTSKKIILILTILAIIAMIVRVWVNVGKCFNVMWTGSDALGETLLVLLALGLGWLLRGLSE